MLKKIRWLAYGAVAVLLAGWALVWTGVLRLGPEGDGLLGIATPGGVTIGGPFTLVDTTGKPTSDADFRGRWMLVYFGYTFCPDVCPTELQSVSNALDLLGPTAARIAPIFITIDPARDTAPVLADYVKLFDPRIVGLTGTDAQVAAAARAYRVFAAKVESKNNTDYLMNHSSFVYLMDPAGRFIALFRQGTPPKEMADGIAARIAKAG